MEKVKEWSSKRKVTKRADGRPLSGQMITSVNYTCRRHRTSYTEHDTTHAKRWLLVDKEKGHFHQLERGKGEKVKLGRLSFGFFDSCNFWARHLFYNLVSSTLQGQTEHTMTFLGSEATIFLLLFFSFFRCNLILREITPLTQRASHVSNTRGQQLNVRTGCRLHASNHVSVGRFY